MTEDNIVAINDIDVATRILEGNKDNPYEVITSRGIKLILHPVPPMLIQEVNQQFPQPKIPTWFNEEKGREEENINDPLYMELVNKVNFDRGMVMVDVLLSGVTIDKVPDGMEKVEDDGWEYYLELVGRKASQSKIPRTIQWLKYYALDNTDLTNVRDKVLRISGGTLEVDVEQATDTFPSDEGRPTNKAIRATRKN